MGGQLKTMRGQLATMDEQTRHLEASVGAAQSNATAAKEGAEATKRNIEMQISKERARITVDKPEKLSLGGSKPFGEVHYKIHIWAPTLAIIVEAQVWAYASESHDPSQWFKKSMEITSKDTRETTVISRRVLLLDLVDDELIRLINSKKRFVHFYGFIKYHDAFQSEKDIPHETTFSYTWEVGTDVEPPTVKGGFSPLPKMGERYISEWVKNPPGSNTET
jgi:hypothetical protein